MTPGRDRGLDDYAEGRTSFAVGLRPQDAVAMPLSSALELLRRRFGAAVDVALSAEAVDLERPLRELPEVVRPPRSSDSTATWLRRTNMVGVNVRTVRDYGGVVKYALTLPALADSIQLLPIWEPGVVESLYGIASWNLNRQFFSAELADIAPGLDTVARQLRATSNLLHLMGKRVGMDVIPHTDRFSEPALGTPDLFEWMKVRDRRIVDHSDGLIEEVEGSIHAWLTESGSADGSPVPGHRDELFGLDEELRLSMLFGHPDDQRGRIARRVELLQGLKHAGLEPVPATMGVPFRGIEVDPDPSHTVVDRYGMEWPDFVMSEPRPMSRVFSPLARFRLHERLGGDESWELDFGRPRRDVWDYVCRHYAAAQHVGAFDFMRGDMSHVQMRPDGVPDIVDEHYDILGAVKTHIQRTAGAPWFAYFAESFLPPRDVFGYGEELDHLDASAVDATLGDLQSTVVGSPEYTRRFRRYLDDLTTRRCAPAYTLMTADKDDPRFDEFYVAGNELRLFTALLLPDMPSYMGLGFEIRDVHTEPVENERYTKLFVFREEGDSNVYPSKARFGDEFVWGQNDELFERLTRIRLFADSVAADLAGTTTRWLMPPDATAHRGVVAWTQEETSLPTGATGILCVTNHDLSADSGYFGVPGLEPDVVLALAFSTMGEVQPATSPVSHNGFFHRIENVAGGEGRVYRIARRA